MLILNIVLLALGPNKVLYFSDIVHKKIYSSHLDGDWKAQEQEVINVGRLRSQKNFQQKKEPQNCIWTDESNEIASLEYYRILMVYSLFTIQGPSGGIYI